MTKKCIKQELAEPRYKHTKIKCVVIEIKSVGIQKINS